MNTEVKFVKICPHRDKSREGCQWVALLPLGFLIFCGGFILKIMETIGTIEEVYSRVMDVIIKNIGSTTEDVEKQILNFM